MDELRGNRGADEYRAVLNLVREGRFEEALERSLAALREGDLGRRHAGRMHSLICHLYCGPLGRPGPFAVLHGEEAVRLADLVSDRWIRCEALERLAVACLQVGDLARAREACGEIERALAHNPTVLDGGMRAALTLKAAIAAAEGDDAAVLAALDAAEAAGIEEDGPSPVPPGADPATQRLRARKVPVLLACGRREEARQAVALAAHEPEAVEAALEWGIARAWVALDQLGPAAALGLVGPVLAKAQAVGDEAVIVQCLTLQALAEDRQGQNTAGLRARSALQRAVAAGRADLARQVRRRVGQLLAKG